MYLYILYCLFIVYFLLIYLCIFYVLLINYLLYIILYYIILDNAVEINRNNYFGVDRKNIYFLFNK